MSRRNRTVADTMETTASHPPQPDDADLLAHYGTRLAVMGKWQRGRSLSGKATTINPPHPQWYGFAEAVYRYDRREYALAAAQLVRIDMPSFLWSHLLRAATWAQLGDEPRRRRQRAAHSSLCSQTLKTWRST